MSRVRALVFGENVHEQRDARVRKLYKDGMHATIAQALADDGDIDAECVTLQDVERSLTERRLQNCDVLFWWGHVAHDQVPDAVVERVVKRVNEGLGFVALHSAHYAKPFRRLMGTTCSLKWREAGERERLWNVAPSHRITRGIGECIELEHAEMYGEPFWIPNPDELIFLSWFQGGEVFRSGATWRRGHGKVFYFRPGHETYPIYHDETIRLVLRNAAHWARPESFVEDACPNVKHPREALG